MTTTSDASPWRRALRGMRWLWRSLFARDKATRRAARHVLVDRAVMHMGFRLYNKDLLWYRDDDFLDVWRAFPEANQEIHERRYTLFSIAKSLRNLDGDSVECGTFAGASSYLICHAFSDQQGHLHHIFDSFEGLSAPDARADTPVSEQARRWEEGDLAASEDRVAANLAPFDFVRLHPGWIPERFEAVSERSFRLVHIDVDLYQPTLDSLVFFYPRLIDGGMIVCDDYGFATCPGATRACDEYAAQTPQGTMIHLTTGQGVLVKRGDQH